MHNLLRRPTQNVLKLETVNSCCEAIKGIGSLIRASYGEKIEMGAEELARIMLLDGCFLLELLLRLAEHEERVDQKKLLQILTDLTLLENQIPFVVLTTLFWTLLKLQEDAQQPGLDRLLALSPEKLAKSLFESNDDRVDFPNGVFHFLHLIHLCSPDPYKEEEDRKHPLQLQRCARKLQAFGITIKASQPNDSKGKGKGTAASVLREFVDKFEFNIEFNATQRELTIPTLHIKATEVKWRNLIAWEQIGLIGIGYKFTSYAYFFKGLVRSVHDLQLLKDEGVIRVHKEARDEDLVIMFQKITRGAEQMDGRYRAVCKELNKAKVNGVAGCCVLVFRMPWHYWRRFLQVSKSRLLWLLYIYLGTAWRIAGVFSGTVLLGLTLTQTVYAIRAVE